MKKSSVVMVWDVVEELMFSLVLLFTTKEDALLAAPILGITRRERKTQLQIEYVQKGRMIARLLKLINEMGVPSKNVARVVTGLIKLMAIFIKYVEGIDNIKTDVIVPASKMIQKLTGVSVSEIRDQIHEVMHL